MLRIVAILLICFILVNLFAGLWHLLRDRGGSTKMVRALTIRVVLSVVLFALVIFLSTYGPLSLE